MHDYHPIDKAIDKRAALIGVVIPRDFAKNIGLKQPTRCSCCSTAAILTPRRSPKATPKAWWPRIRNACMVPIQTQSGGVPATVTPDVRVWYNPDLLSGNFIVPGLIVVIVMIIAANLRSLTIAREWENGTMEQLLSTPARPSELAMGKLAAYFVVGAIDMLISILVGVFVFDVPLKGSVTLLLVASSIFLFGALGWAFWFRRCSAPS